MPQNRSNLSQTPINSDAFNLIPDLATLADTLHVVVPVANQAAGDAVATARAAAGWAVSDARPLFIYNQAVERVQLKDGTGWRELSNSLGAVHQSKAITSSGAISAQAVVNNIASFPFEGGRNYRIVWYFEYSGSVAGNYADMSIHTCSTSDGAAVTTGLTKLGGASLRVHDAGTGTSGRAEALYNPVSDTTLQIKFTAFVWVGAGTVTVVASATQPSTYTIIDEGAST